MMERVEKPVWSAVFATALAVVGLTMSEMLPSSLLTPIARDLGITEGLAGQAATVTALAGLVTSLLIAVVARNLNRRTLLLLISVLQVISNLLVAFAPNLAVLLLGRVLIGVAVGGFWSFSAALVLRLMPEALVPRGLSIIYLGVSLARVGGSPLAIYLGSLVGWRAVFLGVVGIALLGLAWLYFVLPSMPARGLARLSTLFHLLKIPQVRLGMLGAILAFAGNMAFSTYMRPLLEIVTKVGVGELSGFLLGFGLAGFVGNSVAGAMHARSLRLSLASMTLLMGLLAGGFALFGANLLAASAIVSLWGFAFSTVPIGWTTWLTRTVPEKAESGGGLLVAVIQLGNMTGAASGGAAFDASGPMGPLAISGTLLVLCALVVALRLRPRVAGQA